MSQVVLEEEMRCKTSEKAAGADISRDHRPLDVIDEVISLHSLVSCRSVRPLPCGECRKPEVKELQRDLSEDA